MAFFHSANGFLQAYLSRGQIFHQSIRINGSVLESIFSILKHTSGGNLFASAYPPALGRLIDRKSLTQNKNSG